MGRDNIALFYYCNIIKLIGKLISCLSELCSLDVVYVAKMQKPWHLTTKVLRSTPSLDTLYYVNYIKNSNYPIMVWFKPCNAVKKKWNLIKTDIGAYSKNK